MKGIMENGTNIMKKLLPINHKAPITLYPHHSLPLTIPCINDKTMGWYMNNFINIFYRYEYPTVYDYTDYLCFYQGIMDVDTLTISSALKLSSKESFIDFINSDQYIYVWVDQYYIAATEHYQKNHDIHPVLIYGYDLDASVYYCKCFSVTKAVYSAKVNMDEYHYALEQAAQKSDCYNQDKFFRLFKTKDNRSFDFILSNFICEFVDYASGTGKYKDSYYSKNDLQLEIDNVYHHWMNNVSAYGIEVTKLLADAFNNQNIRCFDYRLLHLVCENKQLIADRLQYICMHYCDSERFKAIVSDYATLAKEYDKIRLYAIKFSLASKGHFFGLNYSDEIKISFSSELITLYHREKELLLTVLHELYNLLISHNFQQYKISESQITDCGALVWCGNEYVHSIVLTSSNKHFRGTLTINDETIEINSVSSNSIYVIEVNKMVSRITYISSNDETSILEKAIYVICEYRDECKYLASSIGWAGPNHIAADNLSDYSTTLWCAAENDSEPYIELLFKDPMTADTILIEQHFMQKNLSEAIVQVFQDNEWYDLLYLTEINGKQILKCKFPQTTSTRYRLRIQKTMMDDAGLSKLPFLMLLKVYKDE